MSGKKNKNVYSRTNSSKTNSSKVRSVIGMYIRGEKKIEEIVHPSKISRVRDHTPVTNSSEPKVGSQNRSFATSFTLVKNNSKNESYGEKTILCSDPIITFESEDSCSDYSDSERIDEINTSLTVTGNGAGKNNSTKEMKPIRIDTVNRIKFAGKDMSIGLRRSRVDEGNAPKSAIDCSIHPKMHDCELDLIIEPSRDNYVSEMMLQNQNLHLQVKSLGNQFVDKARNTIEEPKMNRRRSLSRNLQDSKINSKQVPVRNTIEEPINAKHLQARDNSDDCKMIPNQSTDMQGTTDKMKANSLVNRYLTGTLPVDGNQNINEDNSRIKQNESISHSRDSTWLVKSYQKLVEKYADVTNSSLQCYSPTDSNSISAPSSEFDNNLGNIESENGFKRNPIDDDANELKSLKTDVSYYREKISQEEAQISELQNEIKKAEYVLNEYNAANRENASNTVTKTEFEGALKEFLDASNINSPCTNVSNMGLDFVITDYFTKCYDNLSKKVYQCDRERKALSIVIDNLKKERNKLQNSIASSKCKISEIKNPTVS